MTQLSKMIWFDWFTVLRAMTQNIASPYALEIISSPAYISERGVSFYTVRRALTGCGFGLTFPRKNFQDVAFYLVFSFLHISISLFPQKSFQFIYFYGANFCGCFSILELPWKIPEKRFPLLDMYPRARTDYSISTSSGLVGNERGMGQHNRLAPRLE